MTKKKVVWWWSIPISCTLKQWCRGEHIQLLIAYTIDSMITRPKANAKMQKPTPSRQTLKDGPICTGISCEKFTQPFEEILTTQYPTVSEILSTRHILQSQKYQKPDISYSLRNIDNPTYPTVSEILTTQHILQSQKYWWHRHILQFDVTLQSHCATQDVVLHRQQPY